MTWSTSDRASRLPKDWHRIRRRVLDRDRRICQIRSERCTRVASQVDHIEPGDNHNDSNLRAVCTECHAFKSSQEGSIAASRLRRLRKRPTERHPGLRGDLG